MGEQATNNRDMLLSPESLDVLRWWARAIVEDARDAALDRAAGQGRRLVTDEDVAAVMPGVLANLMRDAEPRPCHRGMPTLG